MKVFVGACLRGLFVLACLLASSLPASADGSARRVLFVGNSLTYVNNLPAAFASLAPDDMQLTVDAFARPGARLQDDLGNPVLGRLLAQGRYTDVVFQERGGDAVCGLNEAGCAELDERSPTVRASEALAAAARAGGARVFYLGTYQPNPAVESALVSGEQRIARRMRAGYIEVGTTWQALRATHPEADWLAPDGTHPGKATTALMAIRTWRAVMGRDIAATPCVRGPLYVHAPSESGFFHADPLAHPRTCLVSQAMARVLAAQP